MLKPKITLITKNSDIMNRCWPDCVPDKGDTCTPTCWPYCNPDCKPNDWER